MIKFITTYNDEINEFIMDGDDTIGKLKTNIIDYYNINYDSINIYGIILTIINKDKEKNLELNNTYNNKLINDINLDQINYINFKIIKIDDY